MLKQSETLKKNPEQDPEPIKKRPNLDPRRQ